MMRHRDMIFVALFCGIALLLLYLLDPEKNCEAHYYQKGEIENRMAYEYLIYKGAYTIIFLGFIINARFVFWSLATKIYKLAFGAKRR